MSQREELKGKPTPLPWKFNVKSPDNCSKVSVPIMTPQGQMSISANGLPDYGEMFANAELIVRAVNAHEKLVEALTGLMKVIPSGADMAVLLRMSECGGQHENVNKMVDHYYQIDELADKARAALKLATATE